MSTATWCMLHHDFADEVKFLRIRDMVGATAELAQALWSRLIIHGSKAEDRGSIKEFDYEGAAWYYSKPVALIKQIIQAFHSIGMIDENGRIAKWAKRQRSLDGKPALAATLPPKRQTAGSTRTKEWRDRQKAPLFSSAGVDAPVQRQPGNRTNPDTVVPEDGDASSVTEARHTNPAAVTTCVISTTYASQAPHTEREEDIEIGSESPTPESEPVASRDDEEDRSPRRFAPLGSVRQRFSPPPDISLAELKKQKLGSKLCRFCACTMAQEDAEAAILGLMDDDPAIAQRNLDALDKKMRASGWNDRRVVA